MTDSVTSRIPGFYKKSLRERLARLVETGRLSPESVAFLEAGGGLPADVADRMSENVVACYGLPMGIALNFRVNSRDVLVPMSVEEPSVVAAASNAARLVRMTGGFTGKASDSIMTTQVQFDAVPEPEQAASRIEAIRERIFAAGDASIPGMVRRGGGCRDLDVRVLSAAEGILVVHLYVDVGDAMGANVVDTVAEAVAPLSRLLREHAADPRAPLAAFTLGRVLLDELGRPREAAQSFLRVQELDPSGPLSQDALAREVEAWSRAGEGSSARARALQYVQKYPTGRRLRSVRHFGELL